MTERELKRLFAKHIVFDYGNGGHNVPTENIEPLMYKILELHEEKVKQLAIYLNK